MNEIKNKIEAVLFAAGKKIEKARLKDLSQAQSISEVEQNINILKEEMKNRDSPLMIIEDGDGYKLTLKEKYIGLVQDLIPDTEFPKSVLETLAVIAWKQPVMQADVIKIRTNKAYDHISELEESGFITKEKNGRSFIIRVTPKFFEYFDVPNSKLKDIFSNHDDIDRKHEEEIKQVKLNKQLDNMSVVKIDIKEPKHFGVLDIYDSSGIWSDGQETLKEALLKQKNPTPKVPDTKPDPIFGDQFISKEEELAISEDDKKESDDKSKEIHEKKQETAVRDSEKKPKPESKEEIKEKLKRKIDPELDKLLEDDNP